MDHEYALLGGLNRSRVGRYISVVSATISAAVVYVLLTIVDLAKMAGLPTTIPPSILSLLFAGSVFAVLYWVFDKYAWRWSILKLFLKVPHLGGEWDCLGQTVNSDGSVRFDWRGTLTIVQSWDKIRVRLKTQQSASNSISAALMNDTVDGFVLLYHYKNEPRIEETGELKSHSGFAELVFSKDCLSARGEYFNGRGRNTFGTLKLTRVQGGY